MPRGTAKKANKSFHKTTEKPPSWKKEERLKRLFTKDGVQDANEGVALGVPWFRGLVLEGTQAQPLVREPRSHLLYGVAKQIKQRDVTWRKSFFKASKHAELP